jgi:hypothetical protein
LLDPNPGRVGALKRRLAIPRRPLRALLNFEADVFVTFNVTQI